ncbi:MAG: hypothetical protein M3130_11015 [Actinomycetota bacterium]|nr:hypothetical protein [Actinomycetota bacterium]
MRRTHIAILAAMPIFLATACADTSPQAVSHKSPGSSLSSTPTPSSGSGAGVSPGPGSACRTTPHSGNSRVAVEWVDFVKLDGRQYVAGLDGQITAGQLGAVVGLVRCRLSALKFNKAPGPSVNGDAGFLPVGTRLHAIHGFARSCRVAARFQGRVRVYLAQHTVAGHSAAVPCAKAPGGG